MNTPFAYGEKVLLLDLKQRRYLITLAEGTEFHSHNGFFPHSDLVGQLEGVVVKSTKGSPYTALRPTLEDFVVEMPRGAQVIYPKDLAPMCMLADIGPGVRVLESGVGSGALSMTMLRWGAEIVGYELREDFANRAKANVRSFLGEGAMERYHVELRDCYEGIDERGSIASCSTFRSPGRSCRTRWRHCAPAASSSPTHPRSCKSPSCAARWPRKRGTARAVSRCCTAAGTSRARQCVPTTAWSPTPAS